jgi:phosphoribosylformylglycinamidine synthase
MISIFKGIDALSDFRKKALLKRLQKMDKNIKGVSAEYVHFVDANKLSATDTKKLEELVQYGTAYKSDRQGTILLIVPRLGSISPWSSKATDIAHNSGLRGVTRIERGVAYYVKSDQPVSNIKALASALHDRMTETVLDNLDQAAQLFSHNKPKPLRKIDITKNGKEALTKANKAWGMALSESDIDYLSEAYKELGRNPTDAELMMFAQINSEHCRHKIFNADWIIDGQPQPKSLFKMITNTYENNSTDILSAYSDNAAVLRGPEAEFFLPDPNDHTYKQVKEPVNLVIKVETHNHPSAIAPFPGAATGSGGEIRDEGATGRGSKPKIGLTGFSVSNLNLPGAVQPWEKSYGKPDRITSALDIMIDGPLGGAAFNNEFGRPNLAGYFRTYEQESGGEQRGYHKPIMIAGGLGNIRDRYVEKHVLPVGAQVIVLGGPAMLIGLGGGSGSSMQSGESDADLDFASVQRGNAEIQRRAQEVITTCWSLNDDNPIISIHDVGAGGWSNALPELVHDSGRGALFELRNLPNAEPGLSPMEIWSNESQERYVLGIAREDLERFAAICDRERAPFAVVGETTEEQRLVVHDSHFDNNLIDLPMTVLFGKSSKMTREFSQQEATLPALDTSKIDLEEAVKRVLHLPSVASKKFLITIGDRTVGGLCVRDQMVGPWQVPVSDVAISASSFESTTGEAMTMGERTPLALINAPASGRMAIGEAITNIAAASIDKLSDVKLSANWMAAAGYGKEDQNLYDTVLAIGEDFCPALDITIPVGKDSLSMRSSWEEAGKAKSVTAPLSLIISAFAPVTDISHSLTPELQKTDSELILIDLGNGKTRLGGSALAQVYNQVGDEAPDADPELLKKFFDIIQELNKEQKILAYHDRSDGGLLTTLLEMAFAGRCGLDINLEFLIGNDLEKLFNEELGAVIQVATADIQPVLGQLKKVFGEGLVHSIGKPAKDQQIVIKNSGQIVYKNSRATLESWWAETSYRIQALRDNPSSAQSEFNAIKDDKDPGLSPQLTYKPDTKKYKTRPKVAIFREEGVNGQIEMAAAFDMAGFTAVDVHLNDLIDGETSLDDFVGLAACGGFSYGDVLGAGEGWAKSILFNSKLRTQFKKFFDRSDTFSLGVCNGCQMLSALKELIPGTEHWPRFLKNTSEQFEARVVSVKVKDSPSIFFKDMEGSVVPIPVAHGEGRAEFDDKAIDQELVSLQYVDNYGKITEQYPFNPNGSAKGITGLTSKDGRATIMMPHPERAFLTKQLSWHPKDWTAEGPWLKMFQNARKWID